MAQITITEFIEQWKLIPGLLYTEFSSLGRVRKQAKIGMKYRTPKVSGHGCICLCENKVRISRTPNSIMLELFPELAVKRQDRKFNDNDIRYIRMLEKDGWSLSKLGRKFKVSRNTITVIVNHERYKEVS